SIRPRPASEQVRGLDEADAPPRAVLAQRVVAGRIDGPGQAPDDRRLEAEIARIPGRPAHAVVAREPADEQLLDPPLAQVAGEPGRRTLASRTPVVAEAAVRIDGGIGPLTDDRRHRLPRQAGHELGTGRALHAVIRPEHLLAAVHLDAVVGLAARMRRRERDVPARMPVLCR